jgi:hypothetical protein
LNSKMFLVVAIGIIIFTNLPFAFCDEGIFYFIKFWKHLFHLYFGKMSQTISNSMLK